MNDEWTCMFSFQTAYLHWFTLNIWAFHSLFGILQFLEDIFAATLTTWDWQNISTIAHGALVNRCSLLKPFTSPLHSSSLRASPTTSTRLSAYSYGQEQTRCPAPSAKLTRRRFVTQPSSEALVSSTLTFYLKLLGYDGHGTSGRTPQS